jgi:predicted ester cyclase
MTPAGRPSSKDVARRYFAALDRHDLAAVSALLAPGFRQHVDGLPLDREAYRRRLEVYYEGFPNLGVRLETLIGDGVWVAALTATAGAQTGWFLGHAPTGRSFRATGADFLRVEAGVITERRGAFDTIAMLRQLGLYPGGGPAGPQEARP